MFVKSRLFNRLSMVSQQTILFSFNWICSMPNVSFWLLHYLLQLFVVFTLQTSILTLLKKHCELVIVPLLTKTRGLDFWRCWKSSALVRPSVDYCPLVICHRLKAQNHIETITITRKCMPSNHLKREKLKFWALCVFSSDATWLWSHTYMM